MASGDKSSRAKSLRKTPLIDGTIDSVSMQSLCRHPAMKLRRSNEAEPVIGLRLIEEAIKASRFRVHLDAGHGIQGEWGATCGHEIIQVVLTKWIDLAGVVRTPAASTLPNSLKRKLQNAGFSDTGDKLIVRLAVAALHVHKITVFHIGTTDSDFWDPRDPSRRGNSSAPVACALQEHNIRPTIFKELVVLLTQAN